MFKRISAIGLAIVIVLGMIFSDSQVALATESNETYYAHYENGVFHYQIIDGTAKITKAFISTDHMEIKFPSEVDGIPVTTIGSNVNDWQRTSPYTWINVEIPEGITTIEDSAFTYASIYYLKLPSSITSIGDRAFKGNAIGNVKIASMDAWSKINFGEDGANPLFAGATLRCNNQIVKEYTFSEEIKNIPSRVFQGCASIETITIPNHIESIGDSAFEGCENLMQVNIEDGVTSVGNTCFKGCTSLTSIQFPESVVSMGDAMFEECNSLSTVKIPTNIKHINEKMFCGCTALEEIEMAGDIQSIGNEAFRDSGSLGGLKIPDSITNIGKAAFQNSRISSVEWPGNITTIKENTFAGCQALESITMSSVTTIEQFAFFGSGLESITLPETVQYIGNHAIPSEGCIIYGWVNSYVQTYATSNQIQFEAITFPVTYDANGGYNVPEQQQKKAGEDLQLTNDVPEKEEHAFLGWATTSDGVVEYIPGDIYTNNCSITLYAVWDAGHTVTCHINDGTNELVTQKKYYGEVLQLKNPIRDGYTFKGWSTEPTGDVLYQPGMNYEKDEDITLYAIWVKTYYVSYDTNGGSETLTTQYFEANETVQISQKIPSRIGYIFLGWSDTPSGEVNFQPGALYSQNKDVTLYAIWEKGLIVTYDANNNGGSGSYWLENQTKRKGETLFLTDVIPLRTGYIFSGWSTTPDGSVVYASSAAYKEDSDITLYAQWVHECYGCDGRGYRETKCLSCGGIGTKGSEFVYCTTCGGIGKVLTKKKVTVPCLLCEQTGIVWENNYSWYKCLCCDGKGSYQTEQDVEVTCPTCNGFKGALQPVDCPKCSGGINTVDCTACGNTYGVSYSANGGDGAPKYQYKKEDVALALSHDIPYQEGCVFRGWSTTSDGSVEYQPGQTYLNDEDLRLYAVWTRFGDCNNDNRITDADAEWLLMYTFFPDDYPVNQGCDYNGDNKVNDADAEHLLMYTFFPDDYPLSE